MPVNQRNRLLRLCTIQLALILLAGCGGGSGPASVPGTPQPSLTGVLVDSEVSGVSWENN